ncbi:hypothetical protein COU59_01805 [Candidatus Pacearchaeota archaeon CG10_big_fil_rev_8_21_14_0_10_34_12]|nr:MAG: hypothetical protein COU59_01805 [Candidatus Pacearchaeota archaeon CG10_big_fil_rev_8_21_14_0_10_34_12]
MGDEISFNFEKISDFLKKRKVQIAITGILLLVVIIFGAWMRVQNVPLLVDHTTGENIPSALDPFYFLRIAETILSNGEKPDIDSFRIIEGGTGFSHEILPWVLVGMYKIANVFGNYSLGYIDVIYPVIFFVLGFVAFFFLIFILTGSKFTALLSSSFLTIFPLYIQRSVAGFSDHEAIGMFMFFLTLTFFVFCLKNLHKEKFGKNYMIKNISLGIGLGFLSVLAIASWSGGTKFLFVIIPLSILIFWIINLKDYKNKSKGYALNLIMLYVAWNVSTVIFSLFYGYSFKGAVGSIFLGTNNIVNVFTLALIIVDFFVMNYGEKIKLMKNESYHKYRVFYSALIVFLLGSIVLLISGNLIPYITGVVDRFIHPFGATRTGLTVAENAQPFLNDWFSGMGKIFFWIFCLGTALFGIEISKGIGAKRNKILFSFAWILMIFGILFSRISPTSLFNGTGFLSKTVYFGGLLLFLGISVWIYLKDKFEIKPENIIIASWILIMIVAGRGAVRLFFMISPLIVFMACFSIKELFGYWKVSKDDFIKLIIVLLLLFSIGGMILNAKNFSQVSIAQAKSTGPSVNYQWQNAMSWTRENTPQDSIFAHWWDYGYWVQYLGERPTIADGGHFQGEFRDHMIGRYLLTETFPEVALSFMKSNNISYLLIDPTDFGKYGAYSRIGSDGTGIDRFASIPIIASDPSQTRETGNETTKLYAGGSYIDEDIIYGEGENSIFLPQGNAVFGGAILKYVEKNNQITFSQPIGVYIYNNKQISIPMRYVYYNGELYDFENGLDSVIQIVSLVSQNNNQIQIDSLGTIIYLSPKVSKSLFAQLYLLDNAFGRYPTVKIAHSEPDPLVATINAQGANIKNFVFFNGFRGPLNIWKVEYPSNILSKEEFRKTSGEYAELDNLKVSN